jgi:GNAT superfamily N-acetyltransferase
VQGSEAVEQPGRPFDNAVWRALDGPQRNLAERLGTAVRFPIDIGPFSALPDDPRHDDWDALRELVGPGNVAMLFRGRVREPSRWTEEIRVPCLQMAEVHVDPERQRSPVRLRAADVPEMLELVARTEPGPFAKRTIELGTYLGFREDGALVAMAGERLHCDGWREVSAVCTDPVARGRGLAAALVRTLVEAIHSRGERAFLQVREDNVAAIRLYDALGFAVIGQSEAVVLRAPR